MDERTNKRTKIPNSASDEKPEGDFAQALMMIAELPLSDAEKAEAVRRLLTQAGGGDGAGAYTADPADDQGGER